ncbi:hypothetical protein GMI70_07385 [Eggerthellaceae bacterium zg-893]|nr:hypothetical protein [Eggerthellaceae bacterium zg-893]
MAQADDASRRSRRGESAVPQLATFPSAPTHKHKQPRSSAVVNSMPNRYNCVMTHRQGNITAPMHLNIQDHEMATARAIADYGLDVEFVPQTKGNRTKSADFVAGGVLWEAKAPTSNSLRVVQKRLREALHQSRDLIFDSRRMKGLSNQAIFAEVSKWGNNLRSVRRLLYVDKSGRVTKIK